MKLDEIPELMDIRQLAELLGMNENALRHAAANGTIPADKIGNRWIFAKETLFKNSLAAKRSTSEIRRELDILKECPVQAFYDALSERGKERMDIYMDYLRYLEDREDL